MPLPGLVKGRGYSYIMASEVTTLKHELRDDTVESGLGVSKTLLTSAESTKVLGGLGDDFIVELEVDASTLNCSDRVLAGPRPCCATLIACC